jgi:hypothetical protein
VVTSRLSRQIHRLVVKWAVWNTKAAYKPTSAASTSISKTFFSGPRGKDMWKNWRPV